MPPRKTPLKQGTKLVRKHPIKRMSDKKKQELADTSPMRRAYVENQGLCDACERNTAQDCHEIASGEGRSAACYIPNTYLALCRACHERLQSTDVANQIGIKWLAVLRDVNACRDGRQQFTFRDVMRTLD